MRKGKEEMIKKAIKLGQTSSLVCDKLKDCIFSKTVCFSFYSFTQLEYQLIPDVFNISSKTTYNCNKSFFFC